MKYVFILMVFLLVSCSKGVVPMDNGTYKISKNTVRINLLGLDVDRIPDETVKAVYRKAKRFCDEKHYGAEVLILDWIDSGYGGTGKVTLLFRCK